MAVYVSIDCDKAPGILLFACCASCDQDDNREFTVSVSYKHPMVILTSAKPWKHLCYCRTLFCKKYALGDDKHYRFIKYRHPERSRRVTREGFFSKEDFFFRCAFVPP